MEFLQTLLPASALMPGETTMRLVLAAFVGSVLGFEREWRSRPAGLRTHILVALACAIMAMITIEIIERPLFDNQT